METIVLVNVIGIILGCLGIALIIWDKGYEYGKKKAEKDAYNYSKETRANFMTVD